MHVGLCMHMHKFVHVHAHFNFAQLREFYGVFLTCCLFFRQRPDNVVYDEGDGATDDDGDNGDGATDDNVDEDGLSEIASCAACASMA